ncbi:MAG TPA: hypothetical protein VGX78_01400 [Pirellulales bacterium]|nr:hypothetical protein [Pirellulales bacterium]
MPGDGPQLADALATFASPLLQAKAFAQAEPLLRECLSIRARLEPDAWTTFNTRSMLGGALASQQKYAEAEPLLLAGYEGMKDREATAPPPEKIRLTEALQRIVDFYDATGQAEKADDWRAKLDATEPKLDTGPKP